QTRFGKKKYNHHPGVTDYMDRLVDEAESFGGAVHSSALTSNTRTESIPDQQLSILNSITANELTALTNSVATVCHTSAVNCLDDAFPPMDSLPRAPVNHVPVGTEELLNLPSNGESDCFNLFETGFYHSDLNQMNMCSEEAERPVKRLKRGIAVPESFMNDVSVNNLGVDFENHTHHITIYLQMRQMVLSIPTLSTNMLPFIQNDCGKLNKQWRYLAVTLNALLRTLGITKAHVTIYVVMGRGVKNAAGSDAGIQADKIVNSKSCNLPSLLPLRKRYKDVFLIMDVLAETCFPAPFTVLSRGPTPALQHGCLSPPAPLPWLAHSCLLCQQACHAQLFYMAEHHRSLLLKFLTRFPVLPGELQNRYGEQHPLGSRAAWQGTVFYKLFLLTAIQENKTAEKAWGGGDGVTVLSKSDQLMGESDKQWPGKNSSFKTKGEGTKKKQHTHTFPALLLPECHGSCLENHSPYTRNTASAIDIQLPPQLKRSQKPLRELGRSQLRREGIFRVMEDDHPPQHTGDHCSGPLQAVKTQRMPLEVTLSITMKLAQPMLSLMPLSQELCWLTLAEIASLLWH
ncbi:Mesoderm induction early response protein 3, partial [Lamprotornis superbus]